MKTIEKIRLLRLHCPIIHHAYRVHPENEEEAIRSALLAHYEQANAMIGKLVELSSEDYPKVFQLVCPACKKTHSGVLKADGKQ